MFAVSTAQIGQYQPLTNLYIYIPTGTQEVKLYTFTHRGKTIHLIDTPGFDDTYRTDSDVLRDLAYFLTSSYGNGYKLSGIIYLHPITHTRMNGTAFKNLRTFRKLCGTHSMSSTVLATTMWSDVSPDMGDAREQELRETAEFWGDMIREGSTVYRHTDDYNSAMNIISFLTDRDTKTILGLQAEMVDQKRSLEDTEAGREVDREMNRQRELFERQLENTREELQRAIADKDDQHVREIMQEQEKFEKKLAAIQQGREELRISMEALIAEKEKKHAEELARMSEQLEASQLETKKQTDEWERFKEQTERQRKQDEVENKKREEELEAAREQAVSARLDQVQIILEAVKALQIQDQEAKEREEELLTSIAAEWSRKETKMKNALKEQTRLIERQRQMVYDDRTLEQLRQQQVQLLQQQQSFSAMQQRMATRNRQWSPPPSYLKYATPPTQYQQPSYQQPCPKQGNTSRVYQSSTSGTAVGTGAAVGTGVGLATGMALTGAAMMGGCSVM